MAAEGSVVIIQLLVYTFIHDVAGQRGRERVHGQQLERLFQFKPDLVDAYHDLCLSRRWRGGREV